MEKKRYVASWKDIVHLYELDEGIDANMKMLHKWTDAHIYEDRMPKMKVSTAAHIFSQRAAGIMSGLLRNGELY